MGRNPKNAAARQQESSDLEGESYKRGDDGAYAQAVFRGLSGNAHSVLRAKGEDTPKDVGRRIRTGNVTALGGDEGVQAAAARGRANARGSNGGRRAARGVAAKPGRSAKKAAPVIVGRPRPRGR